MDSASNSEFSLDEQKRPSLGEGKPLSMMERMSRLEKAHSGEAEHKAQPDAPPRTPSYPRPQYHVGAFGNQTQPQSRHAEDLKSDNGYISDTSSTYSTATNDDVYDVHRASHGRLLDLTLRPFCFGFSLAVGLGVGFSFFDWVIKRP